MRVTPDELRGDAGGDIVDVEPPFLPGHLRMEHHLQQDVAQLLAKAVHVARIDRFQRFVGLLEQVSGKRLVGLLQIPWAAARPPEAGHHLEQLQHALPARAG